MEIAHLGRGHTDGDLVVVVSDADLVFAGDLIESAGPPSFGADSVPNEWAGTLDGLIGLMTAKTVAVPGHGEPVGREFVFEQRGRIAMHAAEWPAAHPGPDPSFRSLDCAWAWSAQQAHATLKRLARVLWTRRPSPAASRRPAKDGRISASTTQDATLGSLEDGPRRAVDGARTLLVSRRLDAAAGAVGASRAQKGARDGCEKSTRKEG